MAMCMCEALMPTVGHTAFETRCQYCTLTFSEERVVGMGHRPPSLGRTLTAVSLQSVCSSICAAAAAPSAVWTCQPAAAKAAYGGSGVIAIAEGGGSRIAERTLATLFYAASRRRYKTTAGGRGGG